MNHKISVIVPVYNVEEYLKRCLDSLVNQTYEHLEIIIVNDGSQDHSLAIAESFARKDKRINIINQENAGLSAARNTALQHITGDYVAFLDSDDWLEKDAYAYMLQLLMEKDADICVGAIRRAAQKSPLSQDAPPKEVLLTQEAYAKKYFKIDSQSIEYYVWNKLYKRQVVEGVVFPEGLYAEDVPATFRYILNAQKIVVTDKIIYNYFINNHGLTATFTAKKFDVLQAWDMVVEAANHSGHADYMTWAELNRQRADFALLTELSLSPKFEALKNEFEQEIRLLSQRLKQNKTNLLSAPLPISRKLLIRLYSWNYIFFAHFVNLCVKLKEHLKKVL
ncbi:glycosyltransferase family 2 protein [Streptococcus sp. H49]|uniref:glycosyltransferase family 2 protein n=1 Tax=Streptococcus huangxiaojuni TaxID=3237239 RepID=UPI0034A50181